MSNTTLEGLEEFAQSSSVMPKKKTFKEAINRIAVVVDHYSDDFKTLYAVEMGGEQRDMAISLTELKNPSAKRRTISDFGQDRGDRKNNAQTSSYAPTGSVITFENCYDNGEDDEGRTKIAARWGNRVAKNDDPYQAAMGNILYQLHPPKDGKMGMANVLFVDDMKRNFKSSELMKALQDSFAPSKHFQEEGQTSVMIYSRRPHKTNEGEFIVSSGRIGSWTANSETEGGYDYTSNISDVVTKIKQTAAELRDSGKSEDDYTISEKRAVSGLALLGNLVAATKAVEQGVKDAEVFIVPAMRISSSKQNNVSGAKSVPDTRFAFEIEGKPITGVGYTPAVAQVAKIDANDSSFWMMSTVWQQTKPVTINLEGEDEVTRYVPVVRKSPVKLMRDQGLVSPSPKINQDQEQSASNQSESQAQEQQSEPEPASAQKQESDSSNVHAINEANNAETTTTQALADDADVTAFNDDEINMDDFDDLEEFADDDFQTSSATKSPSM